MLQSQECEAVHGQEAGPTEPSAKVSAGGRSIRPAGSRPRKERSPGPGNRTAAQRARQWLREGYRQAEILTVRATISENRSWNPHINEKPDPHHKARLFNSLRPDDAANVPDPTTDQTGCDLCIPQSAQNGQRP